MQAVTLYDLLHIFTKVEVNLQVINYLYYNNVYKPSSVILSMLRDCVSLEVPGEISVDFSLNQPIQVREERNGRREG